MQSSMALSTSNQDNQEQVYSLEELEKRFRTTLTSLLKICDEKNIDASSLEGGDSKLLSTNQVSDEKEVLSLELVERLQRTINILLAKLTQEGIDVHSLEGEGHRLLLTYKKYKIKQLEEDLKTLNNF